ncbi:MAG: hypothetical protein PWQ12_641 [Clostridiales bacterium]|jgi:uncharacterized protein YnzC (UPF0291/DUF896 family)|nr:hypothetical protein [Clostridiales bacterium]
MIGEEKLARIGELSRKKKEVGLTEAEAEEQQALREEYLKAFRKNFRARLDQIEIVYKDE